MDLLVNLQRRMENDGPGSGWLVGIALCGVLLFFAALGYLLIWRLWVRGQACAMRVYANESSRTPSADEFNGGPPGACRPSWYSTNVLPNKRFFRSYSSISRLTDGVSMGTMVPWKPPVLPPLPTSYSGFMGARSYWIKDGEEEHEQEVSRRSSKASWRRHDNWVVRMMGASTLPHVGEEAEKGGTSAMGTGVKEVSQERKTTGTQPERYQNELVIVQKKRQGKPSLLMSLTAPELSTENQYLPGVGSEIRVQSPQQPALTHHHQPHSRQKQVEQRIQSLWASDADDSLKDILRLTEQRLRDGSSRHLVKSPGSFLLKETPTKTLLSGRSGSSSRRVPRGTPFPSEKSVEMVTPTKVHNRNSSATSIGSAANSLIVAAIEELLLPGGHASPSRLRGKEWDSPKNETQKKPKQQQQQPQLKTHKRNPSLISDALSCLSMFYSVGEPEEHERKMDQSQKMVLSMQTNDDPFDKTRRLHQENGVVRKANRETRQQLTGPQPLRLTKTVSADVDQRAIPAPLETASVTSQIRRAGPYGEKRLSGRLFKVLQPPGKNASEEVKHKISTLDAREMATLTGAPSEASIVSDSAYTDVTASDTSDDMVAADEVSDTKMSTLRAAVPRKSGRGLDISSPLSEREVLSMLMHGTLPKRSLPEPPSQITLNGEAIITIPLFPRLKSSKRSTVSRQLSIASNTSSIYDGSAAGSDDGDQYTSLPSLNLTYSGLASSKSAAPSVGSTVAKLRRTDSTVSLFSVESLASAFFGDGPTGFPTMPSVRGGSFSPQAPSRRTNP